MHLNFCNWRNCNLDRIVSTQLKFKKMQVHSFRNPGAEPADTFDAKRRYLAQNQYSYKDIESVQIDNLNLEKKDSVDTNPGSDKLQAKMPVLAVINRDEVKQLSVQIQSRLQELERGSLGVKINADVYINDINNINIRVVGRDGDKGSIKKFEEMINSDKALSSMIHQLFSISSHLPSADKSIEYQHAYRSARSAAELNNVNAKYSELLSGKVSQVDIKLSFCDSKMKYAVNGECFI